MCYLSQVLSHYIRNATKVVLYVAAPYYMTNVPLKDYILHNIAGFLKENDGMQNHFSGA